MLSSYRETLCEPHPSPGNPAIGAQELVCRERPQRGCLRARRVLEECPAVVDALIDACIQGADPALRPSAYEAFQCLAARCGMAHPMTDLAGSFSCGLLPSRSMLGACQKRAWYQALPARTFALRLLVNSLCMRVTMQTSQQ